MWAVRDQKHDQKLFMTLAGALFALAWMVLWFWGQSPYGRFIRHEGEISQGMTHGGEYSITIIVFVVSWT